LAGWSVSGHWQSEKLFFPYYIKENAGVNFSLVSRLVSIRPLAIRNGMFLYAQLAYIQQPYPHRGIKTHKYAWPTTSAE
jgi:hypothetical protein